MRRFLALVLMGAALSAHATARPTLVAAVLAPFTSVSAAVTTTVADTAFTQFDDIAMFSIPTGVKFKLWFGAPADDPLKPQWVQYKRTRREGGPAFESAYLNKSTWLPATNGNPTLFGFEDVLPRTGHYHYEVRLCTTAGPENCSTWSSSLDPQIGRVGDSPRAWWIYGYLAPTGVPSF